ncbi:Hypothetical predicted protein [Pelobates cultripes]|uniref:Protein TOPAZ1 n=1 Tax=Pelobates cultripes TaxID=61616 RepID=A0AAD1W3Q5_PELCU|nr:Hypothetical predicted protein [Pelobates cultripes]
MAQTQLPLGYCRFFFNTFRGCYRNPCLFIHVPEQHDEKLCMELLYKLVDENQIFLLRRGAWVFSRYYRLYQPGVHYDPEILTKLINALIRWRLWQDIFELLETGITVKILPSAEIIMKLFEKMASAGLSMAVPCLLDIFCKLVESGMILTPVQINFIITAMKQLQASQHDINVILEIKSRCRPQKLPQAGVCSLARRIAGPVSSVWHCKEKCDWIKLGTLFLNVCKGCENLTDLKKFSISIVEALKDFKDDHHDVPYCVFADTVYKDPQVNEINQNTIGRIGISIMYHYHQNALWTKVTGREQVLHKLRELHIQFTVLKGLTGPESKATRCQVVNTAIEIFLKCGLISDAIFILKASEWAINTSAWPCDKMDVLARHNLLCTIGHEALAKSMFNQCFEVLQHLPGFQDTKSDVDVAQYSILFNKLLGSCIENQSLGISSSIVDFMVSKKIPINFYFLRNLITALGQSCLWLRARGHYKCALSLGCYPPLQGNLYHKVLHIPAYLSEIEMLLAIELFMVSNASSIQSPGGSNQTLQIVVKRSEVNDKMQHKDSYRAATELLIQACRLSDPKLHIRHMTVNNCNEQPPKYKSSRPRMSIIKVLLLDIVCAGT